MCINWLNHERTLRAARMASPPLRVVWVHRVYGRVGHAAPLFAVYTMVPEECCHVATTTTTVGGGTRRPCGPLVGGVADSAGATCGGATSSTAACAPKELPAPVYTEVHVRDSDGAWTPTYADMLRDVGYEVRSLHPNGKY